MADSAAVSAAFSLGILTQAATDGLILFIKGHTTRIWVDGPRLALVVLNVAAALWSQINFLSLMVPPVACQPIVTFAALMDQVARVATIQFLLWNLANMDNVKRSMLKTILPQLYLLIRIGLGATYGAFTRADTSTSCSAFSAITPGFSEVIIILDFLLIFYALARLIMSPSRKIADKMNKERRLRKACIWFSVGFLVWTASSIPMLIGAKGTPVTLRETVSGTGFTVLLAITASFGLALLPNSKVKNKLSQYPEAPSPRDFAANNSRDISTSNSSYPPSQYEDLKNRQMLARQMSNDSGFAGDVPTPQYEARQYDMNASGGAAFMGATAGGAPIMTAAQKATLSRSLSSGKASISGPVLQQPTIGSQNPLDKIPTIDLNSAMKADRERRDQYRNLNNQSAGSLSRSSSGSSYRTDPVLNSDMDERVRVMSVLKEESEPAHSPSINGNMMSRATGTQLSPMSDAMRRRSPRAPENPFNDPAPAPSNVPMRPIRADDSSLFARDPSPPRPSVENSFEPRMAVVNQTQTSADSAIRPSRQRPPSVETEDVPPIQKLDAAGLPTNPRARSLKPHQPPQPVPLQTLPPLPLEQPTVMLLQDFQYDNPAVVENIMMDASNMMMKKRQPTTPEPVFTRDEMTGDVSEWEAPADPSLPIVHRPRPIPRNIDEDRAIFPAEVPPNQHVRSRSSVSMQKAALRDIVTESKELPPLPVPPAAVLAQNAKKSTPQQTDRPLPNNTRSMTFKEKMDFLYGSEDASETQTRVQSNQNSTLAAISPSDSRASTSSASMLVYESKAVPSMPRAPFESHEAPNTAGAMQEQAAWLASFETPARMRPSYDGSRRQSSPVLPPISLDNLSEYNGHADDASTTAWGSIHSPAHAVDLRNNRQAVHSTYIQGRDVQQQQQQLRDDEIPMMLDTRFHQRLGQDCPTFTHRKSNSMQRKKVPPAPILVGAAALKQNVIIRAAEPSPLESPDQALQQIQEQLRRIETGSDNNISDRRALLQDLEQEIGAQENQWMQMHNGVSRDSLSTLRTSPARNRASMLEVEAAVSRALSPFASKRNTRLSRYEEAVHPELLNIGGQPYVSIPMSQLASPTPPDSDDEMDMELEMTIPEKEDTRPNASSLNNYLTVARPALSVAASPRLMMQIVCRLWIASASRPLSPDSWDGLWQAAPSPIERSDVFDGLVASDVRPKTRKFNEPLDVLESNSLWKAPAVHDQTSGLWTPMMEAMVEAEAMVSPAQTEKKDRPLTIRPPRRSRRITMLPDILESPKPLPNKRETLGIFQFPWGETSDSANVQINPSNMFMTMPGAMGGAVDYNAFLAGASANMDNNSSYVGGSYFEDYEDEGSDDETTYMQDDYDFDEDYDDYDENQTEATGDDFDESMLKEIASMLKSSQNQLPSRGSLFPQSESMASSVSEQQQQQQQQQNDIYFSDRIMFENDGDDSEYSYNQDSEEEFNGDGVKFILQDRDSFILAVEKADFPEVSKATSPVPPVPAVPEVSKVMSPVAMPKVMSPIPPVPAMPKEMPIAQMPLSPLPQKAASPVIPTMPMAKLWSQGRQSHAAFGLPQYVDSWSKYVSATESFGVSGRATVPHVVDEELQINSVSLWTAAPVSEEVTGLMWAPKAIVSSKAKTAATSKPMWSAPVHESVSFGLPQSSDSWSSYLASTSQIEASARSTVKPGKEMQLETSSLWKTAPVVKAATALLWAPKKVVEPSFLMWSLPSAAKPSEFGLKQSAAFWAKNIAETVQIAMAPRAKVARPTEAELKLESSALWAPKQVQVSSKPQLWVKPTSSAKNVFGLPQPASWTVKTGVPAGKLSKAKSVANLASPTIESSNMWKPSPRVVIPMSDKMWSHKAVLSAGVWTPVEKRMSLADGLFSTAHVRGEYRTTDAEPTTGDVKRKMVARVEQDVPMIESMDMWSASTEAPVETNWISAAVEPVVQQEPVYVEPSYVEPRYVEPAYIELSYVEPTYIEPAYVEPAYVEPVYYEPVYTEPVYQMNSFVDASSAVVSEPMWVEPQAEPEIVWTQAEASWAPSPATVASDSSDATVTQGKIAIPRATAADWDAALAEAQILSLRNTHLMYNATEADWAAALAEARVEALANWAAKLSASTASVLKNEYLRTSATPIDWKHALGEAQALSLKDRHLIKSASPADWTAALSAALAPRLARPVTQMWAKTAQPTVPSAGLWTPGSGVKHEEPVELEATSEAPRRRALPADMELLPAKAIRHQTLWRRGSVKGRVNWLEGIASGTLPVRGVQLRY